MAETNQISLKTPLKQTDFSSFIYLFILCHVMITTENIQLAIKVSFHLPSMSYHGIGPWTPPLYTDTSLLIRPSSTQSELFDSTEPLYTEQTSLLGFWSQSQLSRFRLL